jgi:hypothetical protein
MKKVLLGAAVAMAMMVFAAPAFASDPGFLEICKSSTGLAGTPSFTFDVSNGGGTVVVANNSCSAPITVTPGDVTVTEAPAPFYTVSSISTAPGSALVSSNPQGSGALDSGPNGTAVVSVPSAPDASGAVIVNYTNIPVTGYIEVCKNNASDAGLTGSFTCHGHRQQRVLDHGDGADRALQPPDPGTRGFGDGDRGCAEQRDGYHGPERGSVYDQHRCRKRDRDGQAITGAG